jgi:hypothetical protein
MLNRHDLDCKSCISISTTLILALSLSLMANIGYADEMNPGVFSKDSSPYGIPYGQWISKWWQWNMEIPAAQHPRDNYSPEKCSVNQAGPVWFLPDILTGKEERTCTIPASKAILVPLLTGEKHDDGSTATPLTDEQILNGAKAGNEYGIVSATLDGRQLVNLEQYRIQNPHTITVPGDNIFKNKAGTFKGMADGFFVFLEPLPPGKHDLTLTTSVSNPIESQYNYAAQAIYHLNIEP